MSIKNMVNPENNNYSEYADFVKCCNCEELMLVDRGTDVCPLCDVNGTLSWADDDEDKHEVLISDYYETKYYEIWFYYYGEENEKTDHNKEYTFYLKTEKPIKTNDDMIKELKRNFPKTEKYYIEGVNFIPDEDYDHMSKWFRISGAVFKDGCGVPE
jgi:hypothetical protein